jgi:hypothetical protein
MTISPSQVGEGSQAEIAMLRDRLDAHLAIVNAGDEGIRRRDLKHGVDRVLKVSGERFDDDGRGT